MSADLIMSNEITEFLFSHTWEQIPKVDKNELWSRMCQDKLFPRLTIQGINEICQSIYENNKKNGEESELQCLSCVQYKDISMFFVVYGGQYGNSWFLRHDEKMMESIGGNWEAPFLMVFQNENLKEIHHLPENISNLNYHHLENGSTFFTAKFRYYDNIWIFNSNGEKLGESQQIYGQFHIYPDKDSIKPLVLHEVSRKDQVFFENLSVKWNI